jgi:hypothetical protein
MERAKIARERLELQEKIRDFENMRDNPPESDALANDTLPAKRRGKWLTRLGLKDD